MSMGPALLEALLACPPLLQHAPQLHALLVAAAESARKQQQRLETARKRSSGGPLCAAALGSDSQRLQPQVRCSSALGLSGGHLKNWDSCQSPQGFRA